MPINFLKSLSGKLAENWVANLLTPSFIFWFGGLGAWVWRFSWKELQDWFAALLEPTKFSILIVALVVVAVSASVIQRFDLLVVRFLEGYWSRWFLPIRTLLVQRQSALKQLFYWRLQCLKKKKRMGLTRIELDRYFESYWPMLFRPIRRSWSIKRYLLIGQATSSRSPKTPFQRHIIEPHVQRRIEERKDRWEAKIQRFSALKERFSESGAISSLTLEEWKDFENLKASSQKQNRECIGLTSQEMYDYAVLEGLLRAFPLQSKETMPTRLGNILRAAESRPLAKYGLDPIICWPSFWLVLPEEVKNELQSARANLDNAARLWLWSLLFSIWTIWAWWAFPVGLIAALFTYYFRILSSATTYGQLLEAAFDTHRTLLYKALRIKLPIKPSGEYEAGQQITEYLWRGPVLDALEFDSPPSNS